jgi:hypothetical protein
VRDPSEVWGGSPGDILIALLEERKMRRKQFGSWGKIRFEFES